MKMIKLVSLVIDNFKGVKSKTINFGDQTTISGMNETGKTTVFDAFTWLMFGKNSHKESKFNLKPQDTDPLSPTYGEEIHYLTTSVEGTFLIDGQTVVLKKQSEEDWRKKQGTDVTLFKGNVVKCFYDELPIAISKFTGKIGEIVPEETFRLLTDPMYFNSLEWKKRREILFDVIGDIGTEDVINTNEDLKVLNDFIGNHTVEEAREIVKSKITSLKNEIKVLPARIDEAKRNIDDPADLVRLKSIKKECQELIDNLQGQLEDSSKIDESKMDAIKELNMKISDIETAAGNRKRNRLSELHMLICDIADKVTDIKRFEDGMKRNIESNVESILTLEKRNVDAAERITKLSADKDVCKDEWLAAKKESNEAEQAVKDMDTTCPLCGQAIPEADAEIKKQEQIKKIRANAKKKMDSFGKDGMETAKKIEGLNNSFTETVETIESLKVRNKELADDLLSRENIIPELVASANLLKEEQAAAKESESITGLERAEIDSINAAIEDMRYTEVDNSEIKAKIALYRENIAEVDRSMYKEELRLTAIERVDELTDELKKFGEEVTKLEGQDFLCERFMVAKVELVQEKVRSIFGDVEFKLFNKQINGGLKAACETMVKGVPYSNANSGHQIASGLTILKVLSNHYGVQAPIFIDNRESVNDCTIPEGIESQMIHLFVSDDEQLKVEV